MRLAWVVAGGLGGLGWGVGQQEVMLFEYFLVSFRFVTGMGLWSCAATSPENFKARRTGS